MTSAPRQIGILLFPDVEELDAVGPWEVLAFWTRSHPEDGFAVTTLSREGGRIGCAKGLEVESHHSYGDAPALDVLIYPGGQGTRPSFTTRSSWPGSATSDERSRCWPASARDRSSSLPPGCSPTAPATTHWASLGTLAELDPTIEIRPDDRYVDDGDVITSAGVSAGIDMALHLVRRLAGEERARQVQRGIQYDPAPPV